MLFIAMHVGYLVHQVGPSLLCSTYYAFEHCSKIKPIMLKIKPIMLKIMLQNQDYA